MSRKQDLCQEVIFNEYFNQMFDETVAPVQLDTSEADEPKTPKTQWISEKSDGKLACSYCQVIFPDVQVQREHYKLDWHRYNLKQSLGEKSSVTEEEFNQKTANDDISSISGSDSEEEENSLDTYATAQGKMFLKNKSGQIFSLYKCIFISNKKQEVSEINYYKKFKETCQDNKQWTILMLGGGHFAGAVFDYLTPVVHKTFHCYTVRAGQGGSQSSKDGKSGGSHPKSAGASLRRYNEQALVDHVTKILSSWSEEIKKSSLVFFRASGPYNRGVLFGGKEPLLDRTDPRLRPIPFSTGRATYAEVKRVHFELCTASVYGSLSEAVSQFAQQKTPERDSRRGKVRTINRAKSREVVERPLPGAPSESNSDDEQEANIVSALLEVSFEGLEEFTDSLTPEQRSLRKKKPKKSKNQKLKEKEEARKKNLIDIASKGNVLLLEEVLNERLKTFDHMSKESVAQECFNEALDNDGNSFLHLAAMNEHEDLLQYLLNNQADPCLKNKNQHTPYTCTTSKLSREVFKKFAKENPDKYNYNKAHIPTNALTEEELAEKKRAQRKVKRVKEKEKKKENHLKQQEEDHKQRFLNLSDREKRALAAERRIMNVQGKVIARCFLCGVDIAGKVPFEYLDNRFCSIDCLKGHRMKSTQKV
ncbi:ankyrin repeat and zinc finger domain-containing protein 1-like [Anthonomus grandis grandis]|uniref:ankyrin repeat and zinc finger domain-containing protein 1-like n=1 Tax=Anthonomus grandis grandis TaxID=2921223 RepID=UPI0021668B37|nr:ankyrin repeat and zinc finger domain-containing protein 1-like [Anthonomus grandis grandis]